MDGERVDGEKDGRLRSETLGHEEGTEKRRNWQRSDHGAGGQWRERGVWEATRRSRVGGDELSSCAGRSPWSCKSRTETSGFRNVGLMGRTFWHKGANPHMERSPAAEEGPREVFHVHFLRELLLEKTASRSPYRSWRGTTKPRWRSDEQIGGTK